MTDAMRPGHEDCPHEVIEDEILGDDYYAGEIVIEINCKHVHKTKIHAYGPNNADVVIGKQCLCCGERFLDGEVLYKLGRTGTP